METQCRIRILPMLLLVFVGEFAHAQAATLDGGTLTIHLDRDALIHSVALDSYPDAPTPDFPICCRPSIYLEELFDSTSTAKSLAQLIEENTPDLFDTVSDEIPATNLLFPLNAAVVTPNAPGRQNRATTLSFDPNDIFGSISGRIGLAGVMRFRLDVEPPTNRLLLGDLTMEYDASLEDVNSGRSAWTLINNVGFTAVGFDLFNVTTQIAGNNLLLAGNLGLGAGFDHVNGTRDAIVGTFNLQAAIVPLPASAWLIVIGLAGLSSINRKYSNTWA